MNSPDPAPRPAAKVAATFAVLAPALALVAMTLVLFWPATRYGFINFDDNRYVTENPFVQQGLSLSGIRWAFTSVHELWWLPLLWISYMADTTFFGTGAAGYHLTNVLLHALNALLLFWVLFRMTGARTRSFFVAALFAIHPLRVESVAWIAERKDVLSGLFFFLCLLAYLRQVERPAPLRFGLLHLLMLAGLMAKSALVVLPFLLLLLDYWPLRRARALWGSDAWRQWKPLLEEKQFLFGLAVLFTIITLHTHGTMDENAVDASVMARLSLIAPNYGDYLAQLFWPARLSLIHPPYFPSARLRLLTGAGLLALSLLFWRLRGRCPPLLVGWLWFLGSLLPVIRGIRFDEQSAYSDRYTYLPGIGLALLLCWGAGWWANNRKPRIGALLVLGFAVLAACYWRSARRLPDWTDSPTMFSRLIEFAPLDPHVNNNYGFELLLRGDLEESLPYFLRAATLRPTSSLAVLNYAHVLDQLGRHEELLDWLQSARERGYPDCVEIKALSGLAYLGADRAAEAIPFLRQSILWKPADPAWRIELIRALYEADQLETAREEIRALQSIGITHIHDFDGLIAHYAGLWQMGHAFRFWSFFRNNLRRQPNHVALLNNAAWLLATTDPSPAPPEEALRYARRAAELSPVPHPVVLDTLAAALAANGRFEEARQTVLQAIGLSTESDATPLVQNMKAHLATYQQDQPWRETAIPKTQSGAPLVRQDRTLAAPPGFHDNLAP